jgi:hypothetical protein
VFADEDGLLNNLSSCFLDRGVRDTVFFYGEPPTLNICFIVYFCSRKKYLAVKTSPILSSKKIYRHISNKSTLKYPFLIYTYFIISLQLTYPVSGTTEKRLYS